MITPPRVEGTVKVGRGLRRLGFAEFGPADGRPFVWLHGTPGARRQIPQSARVVAEERGVRIVGIDRPGVGSSTPHRYGSLLDFTTDLAKVADHLGIERFGMIGLSGGGPYALASCYALPDRIAVAGVLGGVAPARGDDAPPGGFVGRIAPLGPLATTFRAPLSLGLTGLVWAMRPLASTAFELYARISPEGDQRVFARPEIKAMFLDDFLSGSRRGMAAPILDFLLFSRAVGLLRSRDHGARALVARERRPNRAAGPRPAHGVAHPRRRAVRQAGREPSGRVRCSRGGAHEAARRLGRARVRHPRRSRMRAMPLVAHRAQAATTT